MVRPWLPVYWCSCMALNSKDVEGGRNKWPSSVGVGTKLTSLLISKSYSVAPSRCELQKLCRGGKGEPSAKT